MDYSDPGQVQPYLESLKQKHGLRPRPSEQADAPVPSAPSSSAAPPQMETVTAEQYEPYLQKLRDDHGLESPRAEEPVSPGSPGSDVQPYLESVKAGKPLAPRFRKIVDEAAGFTFVASSRFKVTSDKVQANSFENVYGTADRYSPGVDLFYERQVYRSREFGAIGPVFHLGLITAKGKGIFTRTGTASDDTEFRFYAAPISVGLSYRLVQLRFVAPFVQLAAVGIPFIETRNDDRPSRRAISRGYSVVGGAAFSLDWVSGRDAWEQYDAHGVLHTYLVVQFELLRTLGGPVAFNYDGMYAGLMFEF